MPLNKALILYILILQNSSKSYTRQEVRINQIQTKSLLFVIDLVLLFVIGLASN